LNLSSCLRLVLSVAVLVTLPTVSHGQGTSLSPSGQVARAHTERGRQLFQRGDFRAASAEFEAAYTAAHQPALLYNLGQCFRNLDEHDRAITAFRRYLDEAELAVEDQAEVLATIAELERAKAEKLAVAQRRERDPLRAAPAGPRPAPARSRALHRRWWFWPVVAGATTAVGVSAAYAFTRPPDSDLGHITLKLGTVTW
jgi:hypothetical protein